MKVSKNKYLFVHIAVSILFFLVSASYGWLIRFQQAFPALEINYTNYLQAHSHVTFLGWGFLTVISLVSAIFISDEILNSKLIKITYWSMVVSLASLLFSFPLQGYKLFSILFLTIFLLNSYVYLYFIYKKIKLKNSFSSKYITTGIQYYFLSSLAIWFVPILVVKFGKGEMYQNAIFLYLHFLYNGFFVFTLFGILLNFFEKRDISFPKNNAKRFFLLTNIACVPAYALSLLWSNNSNLIIAIGFLSAVIQLISLFYLYQIFKKLWNFIPHKPTLKLLLFVIAISYYLKILMQFFGAFPSITNVAKQFKPYLIIGYLHLFTLGFMSLFLFLLLYIHTKFKLDRIGLFLFTLGIVLSELVLFLQGVKIYMFSNGFENYKLLLFYSSTLMPIGIIMILVNHLRTKKHQLE